MSTFWSSATLVPKRSFRYTLDISPTDNKTIWPNILVKSFTKPGLQNLVKETTFHIEPTTGKTVANYTSTAAPTYTPMEVVLVEDSVNEVYNTANTIVSHLVRMGFATKNYAQEDWEIDRDEGQKMIGDRWFINELSPNGKTAGQWTIIGPRIRGVTFSSADYAEESLSTVTLDVLYESFRYDIAVDTVAEMKSLIENTTSAFAGAVTGTG